jgi:hypothetical protein
MMFVSLSGWRLGFRGQQSGQTLPAVVRTVLVFELNESGIERCLMSKILTRKLSFHDRHGDQLHRVMVGVEVRVRLSVEDSQAFSK